MNCSKCGQSLYRLALLAMAVDAGAKCSPSPLVCVKDGGEHDFARAAPGLRAEMAAEIERRYGGK